MCKLIWRELPPSKFHCSRSYILREPVLDYSSGDTAYDSEWWHILCHHRTCSNDSTIADFYTLLDKNILAYPYIITDSNGATLRCERRWRSTSTKRLLNSPGIILPKRNQMSCNSIYRMCNAELFHSLSNGTISADLGILPNCRNRV